MNRLSTWLVLAGCALSTATATAQGPALFRWQQGQVLTYKVEQATSEIETVGGTRAESSMKLNVTKRWQVLAVDAAGVATVQQSLLAMRIEKISTTGEKAVFDSTNLAASDPPMKEQLGKYVGTPLAVLRINGQGRVLEVKECKFTTPSRYEHELPFVVTLPPTALLTGASWQRDYQVTLEPPFGTGEKYPATQTCTCKGVVGARAVIAFTTAYKSLPPAPGDQVPLIQFMPEGEVVFNLQAGRMEKATLKVEKALKNHQGDDSSYQFKSSSVEEFMGVN